MKSAPNIDSICVELKNVVGQDSVITDVGTLEPYLRDIAEYQAREVPILVKPKCINELREIVRIANESSVALYPISTGRNWGLGSRRPVIDQCIVVDMSNMAQIRELCLDSGYAIIEPGVSQYMLSELLKGTPYMLNVTGSCAHTSIIGNALERGVGFIRQRTQDTLGLEVLLGTGELVRVGSFWSQSTNGFHYKHGIGPELTQMFVQSNFGIVTAAAIDLIKRPESSQLLQAYIKPGHIEAVIDKVANLYEQDVFNTVVKVFNINALSAYGIVPAQLESLSSKPEFVMFGVLKGKREIVQSALEVVRQEFEESEWLAHLEFTDCANSTPGTVEDEIIALYNGTPTSKGLHNVFNVKTSELDVESRYGWVTILPIIPLTGADISSTFEILRTVSDEFQIVINATINVISLTAIDLVTSIVFPRDPDSIERAHQAQSRLYQKFKEKGICISRLDIEHQNPEIMYGNNCYTDTLRKIKFALDPEQIISPGRYVPHVLG